MRLDLLKRWYREDTDARLGTLIGISALTLFLLTAAVVESHSFQSVDEQLLLLWHPDEMGWRTEAARDLTALGGYLVLTLIVVATSMYLKATGQRRAVLFFVGAVVSGFLVNSLLKFLFDRPRPAVVEHLSYVDSSSFPSGHAMMSTIVYLTAMAVILRPITHRTRRHLLTCALIVLIILVGCSRVLLGVHYLTDVLGGWSAGTVWTVVWCLVVQFQMYRATELSRSSPSVVEVQRRQTRSLDRSHCDV